MKRRRTGWVDLIFKLVPASPLYGFKSEAKRTEQYGNEEPEIFHGPDVFKRTLVLKGYYLKKQIRKKCTLKTKEGGSARSKKTNLFKQKVISLATIYNHSRSPKTCLDIHIYTYLLRQL